MALENADVLSELKVRLESVTKSLNDLGNTRVKLQGAIEVLEQIEDSKAADAEAQDATKSTGDVGEGSIVDGESSEGTDSSDGDSGANEE
jgi:hypothetical protein